MSLFYAPDIEKTWELPEEEAAHCLRVLRLGVGDQLEVTDGKGKLITDIKGYEKVTLEDMAKRTTVLAMKSYEL